MPCPERVGSGTTNPDCYRERPAVVPRAQACPLRVGNVAAPNWPSSGDHVTTQPQLCLESSWLRPRSRVDDVKPLPSEIAKVRSKRRCAGQLPIFPNVPKRARYAERFLVLLSKLSEAGEEKARRPGCGAAARQLLEPPPVPDACVDLPLCRARRRRRPPRIYLTHGEYTVRICTKAGRRKRACSDVYGVFAFR